MFRDTARFHFDADLPNASFNFHFTSFRKNESLLIVVVSILGIKTR